MPESEDRGIAVMRSVGCSRDRVGGSARPGKPGPGGCGGTLNKHLRFAGVMVVTLVEGEISELHAGLKGTMNAPFLKDLAAKTHRGLRVG